jgi:hypothetical protein
MELACRCDYYECGAFVWKVRAWKILQSLLSVEGPQFFPLSMGCSGSPTSLNLTVF